MFSSRHLSSRSKHDNPTIIQDPSLKVYVNILLVTVQICVLLFSFVLFGWTSLAYIFIEEGVYACDDADDDTVSISAIDDDDKCSKQIKKLNLIYTLSVMIIGGTGFISGYIIDHIGPAYALLFSSVVGACSCLILYEEYYLPGMLLLSSCATLIYFSAEFIGYLSPKKEHLINTLIALESNAATVVFYFFFLIYMNSSVTLKELFLGYGIMFLATVSFTALVWVRLNKKVDQLTNAKREEKRHQAITALNEDDNDNNTTHRNDIELSNNNPDDDKDDKTMTQQDKNKPAEIEKQFSFANQDVLSDEPTKIIYIGNLTFKEQIKTYEFIFYTLFLILGVSKINFFIGYAFDFFESIGDDNRDVGTFFSIALPGSIIFAPIVDWIIAKYGLVYTFYILDILGLIYSGCTLIPVLWVQYITCILFTLWRGIFFSILTSYVLKIFGAESLAGLTGLAFSCMAPVQFLQYPLVNMVYDDFDGDYFVCNLIMALIFIPQLYITYKLHQKWINS